MPMGGVMKQNWYLPDAILQMLHSGGTSTHAWKVNGVLQSLYFWGARISSFFTVCECDVTE